VRHRLRVASHGLSTGGAGAAIAGHERTDQRDKLGTDAPQGILARGRQHVHRHCALAGRRSGLRDRKLRAATV